MRLWTIYFSKNFGLPKSFASQCRQHGFPPWVSKIPSRRQWQPIPVFLHGKPHRPWRATVYVATKRAGHDSATKQQYNNYKPQLSVWKMRMTDHPFSVQFSHSVASLCEPMNRSTPGLPVHHQLLEFTQTHVHQVSDAIQPSHPVSSPSPPAPNPSQHQSFFQWVSSSHEVAKVLEFQL